MFDDLPPDLHRLEVLRTWHAMWVERIDAKIRQVRERDAQQAQASARVPDWLIEYGLNRDAIPNAVHVGGCRMAGKRSKGADSDTARRALAGGVLACMFCRPDTELGYIDG